MIWIILSFISGTWFGVFLMALMVIAKRNDLEG